MRSDNAERKPLKSYQLAAVYLAVWLVPVVGVKLLADEVLDSLLLHAAFTMMAVPGCAFGFAFSYAKRGGQRLWLAFYMTAAVLILYFACGFGGLQPDFLVTNIICGFFGSGIGGIFRNEPLTAARQAADNARKLASEQAEKDYEPIIGGKSKRKKGQRG